jgi:putative Mg2+ transporter-C (MgtC) family protein
LMTGIGFIGGGAILKEGTNVRGTATAASVWATGALGAAAAYGQYEIAIILAAINFLALWLLTPLGKRLNKEDQSER